MLTDRATPKQTLLRACDSGDTCRLTGCACGPRVEVTRTRVVERAGRECDDCRIHRTLRHEDVRDLRDFAVIDAGMLALLEVFDTQVRSERRGQHVVVRRRLDTDPFVDEDGRFGDLC